MNFKKLFTFVGLALLLAAYPAFSQTVLTNTTLSAAITDPAARTLLVTSATNITGTSFTNPQANTYLVIDSELVNVESVSGTLVTVQRAVSGTTARTHASGAIVFVVPAYLGTMFTSVPPTGSCTRTSQVAVPVISVSNGQAIISDCLGGQWINGDAGQTTRATWYRLESPTIGAVSNGSAIGTSTATVAAELYCTEVRFPYSRLVTGLAFHIGATGGTDKWIGALYDSGGNLVANSAVAGTTVSGTAYAWQVEAFTTPYYVVGPGQYFACLMSNGTTATADLVATGKDDNILTFKSASAGTFGTLPSFTAPTAFTTVNGAYSYVY